MSTIPEESYQFKNLVLSDKYLDKPSKLAAVIGVDDNGEPILFDFAKNPHLFIGGDQGCGKSTLIHSIIMSLMQRNTPEEFQFVYLDAKGLDVNLYKQSKYLHISREHHIPDIFNYLLHECNNRTRILSDNKKKTVSAYNELAALYDDVIPISELFVFIDEASYLLEENQIRQHIEELNNYGRAVGIHLVIADTNPTLCNVLRIAKQIPNKIVFRFTYADYKALLERKNVVPLSDDGEILCDFRGAEYVHGHSCFVSEEEIKGEVAKNIVEIKEVKHPEKATEEPEEKVILQEEKPEQKKMPFEALRNKKTIDAREYPEYAQLLKDLGIIDVDKITEPQTVVVSKTEHKAKLLGISEELAECYGDITLNIQPTKKPKLKDKIKSFFKKHPMFTGAVVLAVIIAAIYLVLNLKVEILALIAVAVLVSVLAVAAIKDMIKWHKYKPKPKTKRNKYSIYAIDNISDGHTFEYVVADLLKNVGFYNVKVTVGSGDFGIDVIGWYGDASYAIQCKKYSNKVGISAVQEAYSGRSYYGCNYAVVVTNNYFTPAAIKLAKSNGVILWDRTMVKKLINGHL